MFTIVPKNPITPTLISEVEDESYSFFQNRKDLHETIDEFQVYINQYAWNAFLHHSMNVYKQTEHEAQGIFLGKYFKDSFGEFAVATEYSEGVGESSRAYVGMSEECVAEISKKCSAKKLMMLIWIHTHPNFGVFYSGTDVNCLKTNFFMPFQSGIVVDIIRHESKGFKVEGKNVNEFAGYSIYNIPEKRLFKPYEVKVDTKSIDIKKNENPKNPEFPTKEILAEFEIVKKELAELKSIVNKKPEQPKPQPQVDSVAEHKAYFETKFGEIKQLINPKEDSTDFEVEFGELKQLINRKKDSTEDLQNLIEEQAKFKKYLTWFLIGLSCLFGLGIIAFIYFFIKSFFGH